MGAWMSYGLGTENESLPRYVVLCPGRPVRFAELWSSGFLPAEHQGTYVNHSQLDPQRMTPPSCGHDPVARRSPPARPDAVAPRAHLAEAPRRRPRRPHPGDGDRLPHAVGGHDAFDLPRTQAVRDDYGHGHFANGCLLARRLVERGVRFVQVYYGDGQPWDTHTNHNATSATCATTSTARWPPSSHDLKQRGLLDETLVIWGGEFGRTPTTEARAATAATTTTAASPRGWPAAASRAA